MSIIKLKLSIFVLALAMLTALGTGQDSWNLGSSDDWLSTGPVYHNGPVYYPNSDLSIGTQRFLNNYPGYIPPIHSNNYQTYNPRTGTYTLPSSYLLGDNNPYYAPQYQLNLANAKHAYNKSLAYYYGSYPYFYDPQYQLDLANAKMQTRNS